MDLVCLVVDKNMEAAIGLVSTRCVGSGRGVAVLQPVAHALHRVLADDEQGVLDAGSEAGGVQAERHQRVEGRLHAVGAELRSRHGAVGAHVDHVDAADLLDRVHG